jgi:hypothetical protein
VLTDAEVDGLAVLRTEIMRLNFLTRGEHMKGRSLILFGTSFSIAGGIPQQQYNQEVMHAFGSTTRSL